VSELSLVESFVTAESRVVDYRYGSSEEFNETAGGGIIAFLLSRYHLAHDAAEQQ